MPNLTLTNEVTEIVGNEKLAAVLKRVNRRFNTNKIVEDVLEVLCCHSDFAHLSWLSDSSSEEIAEWVSEEVAWE